MLSKSTPLIFAPMMLLLILGFVEPKGTAALFKRHVAAVEAPAAIDNFCVLSAVARRVVVPRFGVTVARFVNLIDDIAVDIAIKVLRVGLNFRTQDVLNLAAQLGGQFLGGELLEDRLASSVDVADLPTVPRTGVTASVHRDATVVRSEEHTSELQSHHD